CKHSSKEGIVMGIGFLSTTGLVAAIIAIVFGIIVMVKPKVLAYLVGIYLIITGVIFFIQRG
ncbi:MAG: DUF3096 domain-containing protein, partial [Dehalococcoidales bacterium]|nr:DUF3096 domain-containing protein [Dehalococcoidales bacterium]